MGIITICTRWNFTLLSMAIALLVPLLVALVNMGLPVLARCFITYISVVFEWNDGAGENIWIKGKVSRSCRPSKNMVDDPQCLRNRSPGGQDYLWVVLASSEVKYSVELFGSNDYYYFSKLLRSPRAGGSRTRFFSSTIVSIWKRYTICILSTILIGSSFCSAMTFCFSTVWQ